MAEPSTTEQGSLALATSVNAEHLAIIPCHSSFTPALLRNLTNNTNVMYLSFQSTFLDETVGGAAMCQLLETTTTLRGFELGPDYYSMLDLWCTNHYDALLRAVANSKLERFSIGLIPNREKLLSLVDMIPSWHIRELEVSVSNWAGFDSVQEGVLRSIEQNFSLRSVNVSARRFTGEKIARVVPSPPADQDAYERKLAFYLNRNQKLHRWAANDPDDPDPVRLDEDLVPLGLGLAAKAGQNTLYASLRSRMDYLSSRAPSRRPKRQCMGRVGGFSPPSW